jgi:hypothetical protein
MLSIRFSLLLIGLLFLNACRGNQALESRFAADPKLQEKLEKVNASQANSAPSSQATQGENKLPEDFPAHIPIYSPAQIIDANSGKITWTSADPSNLISNFYQQELKAKNWSVSEQNDNSLVATNNDNDTQIKLFFTTASGKTEFTIEYQPPSDEGPSNASSSANNITEGYKTPEISKIEPITPEFNSYLQDLVNLGIIKPDNQSLDPHQPITRREYARWLVMTNNDLHGNSPSQQIRLASPNAEPAFTDVDRSDPDFGIIQGLAEAGLIPSILTKDSTVLSFRPEAPLTREDLIAWKVPLDARKALPPASLDTIKETWGFQDAANIEPQVWKTLYLDWQNGESANVRRVFGYTTLFQPKKPVTRAEAAAALGYFGYQGEGKSVREALATKNNPLDKNWLP